MYKDNILINCYRAVFFFLTAFDTLMARKESDGSEVIKLLKELESESWCKGKQFWPELIGLPTKLAKEIIEKENPSINDVPIILNGSPVPLDYRCNRVRLIDNILAFEILMARKEGDGPEVIKLLKKMESESWCKGKQFWPELIGVPTKLAKEIIEKENSLINNVQILLNGSPVTMDYRCNRVRLFDNILGSVVQIPRVA
ncbi:hypothetical protein H5410_048488 [Solanum commersonii]|uniref:Uncharacterized protein n=1 Tax=Solanum commersonii TaxID=4109 RepID=A0A9J5XLV9_SOLCO|nr:hypothetical protein H5410_048488 [Solanum commersonii]